MTLIKARRGAALFDVAVTNRKPGAVSGALDGVDE
jgi:hypothetical protein